MPALGRTGPLRPVGGRSAKRGLGDILVPPPTLFGQRAGVKPDQTASPEMRVREFCTTHWSVVLASRDPNLPGATAALECLCRSYWYPLYAYLRRDGYSPHDAQDLTQEFLTRLIVHQDLRAVEPGRGKFRSYLLVTLKHFLSDERKRARAQKRGGGHPPISIDEAAAESRYWIEPADAATPETVFERQWGLVLLERVLERLGRRYAERGKVALFNALSPCLAGSRQEVSHARIATGLGVSEASLKIAVHRMRKEFGVLLRAELAQTVGSKAEIDDELRRLVRVTSG